MKDVTNKCEQLEESNKKLLLESKKGELITVENKDGNPVIKSKEVSEESEDSLLKKNLYIKEKYNIA